MGIMDGGGVADLEGRQLNHQKNNHNHHHYYHYNHPLFGQLGKGAVLLGLICVTCFFLYRSTYPFQVFPLSSSSSSNSADEGEAKLKGVLKKAAMGDKTVIITTLNEAWAAPNSILDVFLESFRIGNQTKGLLSHLVVVALDQKAYDRCLALHLHCYALGTNGTDFSGEAEFRTPTYLDMMWRRILFLQTILELGYNFVFTDADIMWFRDPFLHFYSDADFQIACDYFRGNTSDLNNQPNGGFNYVKSNNHTIDFYKFWYSSRMSYPDSHDQDVLNKIKFDPFLTKIGIKMRFLDTKYYGGICEPSKDFNEVCTMHANCCVGLDRKVHDLNVMLEDWRKFLRLPYNVRASQPGSWRVPQNCSLEPVTKKKFPQGEVKNDKV